MHFTTISLLAAGISSVSAHGLMTSPAPRAVGPATQAACGSAVSSLLASDPTSHVEGLPEAAATDSTFDATKCNLFLCKGLQFADNTNNVVALTPGAPLELKFEIPIPHEGPCNVSVIDTKTNTAIGAPLIVFDSYADEALPVLPKNNTDMTVTVPSDLGSKCATAGDCVIQWFWFGTAADQTYESCLDFTVGGSASAVSQVSSSSTAAVESSAVAVAAAVPATTAETSTSATESTATTESTSSVAAESTSSTATSASIPAVFTALVSPSAAPSTSTTPPAFIAAATGTIPTTLAAAGNNLSTSIGSGNPTFAATTAATTDLSVTGLNSGAALLGTGGSLTTSVVANTAKAGSSGALLGSGGGGAGGAGGAGNGGAAATKTSGSGSGSGSSSSPITSANAGSGRLAPIFGLSSFVGLAGIASWGFGAGIAFMVIA